MQTITTQRAETRTISIEAPTDAVFDLVADPYRLPEWAPNFARGVRQDGGVWLIDDGTQEREIVVQADRARGTVDLLAGGDPRRGAFSRVVPNGAGSEFLFTLFFPDGTDEAVVTRQMDVVEEELATVRALCTA
jgi:hypothetical protein